MSQQMQVQLLTKSATLPTRGSAQAAGYDVHADLKDAPSQQWLIAPGGRAIISTGIAVACPPGHYVRVAPRSGLAAKHGIDVLAGVVDEDYRGEIKVILYNTSHMSFMVDHGMRIAQLIVEKCANVDLVAVTELSETLRGSNGFGSTGT